MLHEIKVSLADRSYPLFIGSNHLSSLGSELKKINFPPNIAIISNPTVDVLYGQAVFDSLVSSGYHPVRFNVADGEEYKSLPTLELIYNFLLENHFDRGCGLIALGGGVVGDMAGFAAATFLRGIPYVQIPTTLLSQVDSSVGGKTAVNHPLGKNLIGAFYQPELVLIDIDVLKTLDPREVSAGLAEVVKYGVIHDADFFKWMEDNVDKLTGRDPEALIYAIKKSCQIKSDIVAVDEREGSIRAFLNFGHTFGHAIENLSGYGQWKHGEAVAAGMVVAAKISVKQGLCSQEHVDRIRSLLQSLGLPTDPPEFSLDEYIVSMQRDKKVKQGHLTLVLNRGIGEVVLHKVDDIASVFSSIL
ncbi:3-dehydroquinate synthase [Desulfuromusa kysingii]|uniref:3-dehydroquinate synthase n=1 Tax=Desulfuromusa kysingii TaxID=37625 RepID=A0A1H4CY76_9BACT|nr:3-dehydroquinate synthase [Desulfuromusa kysingii]SEA65280.1 3-dehydroquinate synthase [Desulfuromusa kysingii]